MTIYATGVDYSNPQTPPRVLVAHGAKFVGRYASTSGNPKNLTENEVKLLAADDIGIVSIFETTAGRALNGESAGADDIQAAVAQHQPLGMPDHAPICLTVDFDAQPSNLGQIERYFQGAASEAHGRPLGVYGGMFVCNALLSAGLAEYVFQTYAWSHGQWASKTHLRQVQNGIMWDGWAVDLCEAHEADYGAWLPTHPQPPQPPQPPTEWTVHMISNLPTIDQGAHDPVSGERLVARVQALVTYVGGHDAHGIDGDFGPHTRAAVVGYQGSNGLTADGIVGPHTWTKLLTGQTM